MFDVIVNKSEMTHESKKGSEVIFIECVNCTESLKTLYTLEKVDANKTEVKMKDVFVPELFPKHPASG